MRASLGFMLFAGSSFAAARAQSPAPAAAAEELVRLEGRVVDQRGEPVPLADVWVLTYAEPERVLARSKCDGEGCFVLARVPKRQTWTVHAHAKGRIVGRTVTLSGAGPVVVALHDGGTVRGTVCDRSGRALAGIHVRAGIDKARNLRDVASMGMTDVEGRFELKDVPLGEIDVRAIVPGEGIAEATLHLREDAEVALTPSAAGGTSLSIVVEGLPEDAVRTARVDVSAYAHGGPRLLPSPWDRPQLDRGGTCRLDHAPDWRYVVRVYGLGFTFTPAEVTCEPGKGPHELRFRARPIAETTHAWRGALRDAEQKPLSGIRLALRHPAHFEHDEAVTSETGEFEFQCRTPAGSTCIAFSLDDRWVLDQEKTADKLRDLRSLVDHETTVDVKSPLELRAVPASSVSCRVVLADGTPAAFERVKLEEASSPVRRPRWMAFAYAITDRDGRCAFLRRHHLPAPVRVTVESTAGAASSEEFALAAAGTKVTLPDLKLCRPAIVEGIIRDASGAAAPGVRVWLRDWDLAANHQKSGSVIEVITDRSGRYRYVGVPPGGAYLQIVSRERSPAPRDRAVDPFEVKAGERLTFDLTVELPAGAR